MRRCDDATIFRGDVDVRHFRPRVPSYLVAKQLDYCTSWIGGDDHC